MSWAGGCHYKTTHGPALRSGVQMVALSQMVPEEHERWKMEFSLHEQIQFKIWRFLAVRHSNTWGFSLKKIKRNNHPNSIHHKPWVDINKNTTFVSGRNLDWKIRLKTITQMGPHMLNTTYEECCGIVEFIKAHNSRAAPNYSKIAWHSWRSCQKETLAPAKGFSKLRLKKWFKAHNETYVQTMLPDPT